MACLNAYIRPTEAVRRFVPELQRAAQEMMEALDAHNVGVKA